MTSSTPSVQNVGPETEPVEVKLTQLAMQQHEVTDSAATVTSTTTTSLDNLLQSNSFKVCVHKGIKQSQLHAVVATHLSTATGVVAQDIQSVCVVLLLLKTVQQQH
jgi:hypothetical protein